MSKDLDTLREAIDLNRQQLVEAILARLGFEEVDEILYAELLTLVELEDAKRMKYIKALESQEIIDAVLKDKLE